MGVGRDDVDLRDGAGLQFLIGASITNRVQRIFMRGWVRGRRRRNERVLRAAAIDPQGTQTA